MFIYRVTKQEQEHYSPTTLNGFSPTLCSVEEVKLVVPTQRASSLSASNRLMDRSEGKYYLLQFNLFCQQPDSAAILYSLPAALPTACTCSAW